MSRLTKLRSHLIFLVVLSIIPLLVLAGWLIITLDREYRHGSREHVLRTARALSEAVDSELDVARASLEVLTSSPLLDAGDLRGFHNRMVSVAQTRGWTTVVLFGSSGEQLLNAAYPFDASLASSEHAGVYRDVVRTGKPAVSGLVVRRGSGQAPSLGVGVPVLRNGAIHHVLVAGVAAADVGKILTAQPIPPDWRIGLNDRNQLIVTSTLEPDPFVGQRVTTRMAQESDRADEGWFPNIDKEGRPIYAAFHRSPLSGLVLVMNVPGSAVDGPANRSALIVGGGGLLLLVGSLAAALVLGRRLAASVIAFRDAAGALGRGEPAPTHRVTNIREFREAHGALDAAAALLAARAAERDRLLAREQLARVEAERAARMLRQVQLVADTPLWEVTPASLMREVLARVRDVLASDTATILLLSEDGAHLTPVSSDGLREEVVEDLRIPLGRGVAGRIVASEVGMIFPDLAEAEVLSLFLRDRVKSLMGAPLRVGDRLIGVIHVGSSAPHQFTLDDLTLLRLVADRVALVIERERLHAAERAARREAESASQAKDEFLAMLSHELRSPLNAIAGWLNVLRRQRGDLHRADRAVEVFERNTRLLTKLVDDLLDVSRIVAGRLAIERQSVDVVPLVAGVLEEMRPAAVETGVTLHAVLEPRSGAVWGDPARLHQVVGNLVANAIKFTPAGGFVEVRVHRGDTHVQVTVSDTGRGIHPEFLPHIFDRFRQEDAIETRTHGGLGLGLAIVRHLVELHGGTVDAESSGEGRGARLTVRLPVLKEPDDSLPA